MDQPALGTQNQLSLEWSLGSCPVSHVGTRLAGLQNVDFQLMISFVDWHELIECATCPLPLKATQSLLLIDKEAKEQRSWFQNA